jgi:PKD repeat protein
MRPGRKWFLAEVLILLLGMALLLLSACDGSGGSKRPRAGFSGTPSSGAAPLTVNFTDQSEGEITDWLWDFGDGQTSTLTNPTHTYDDVGTYTVSLTVEGPRGTDTEAKTDYITVGQLGTISGSVAGTTVVVVDSSGTIFEKIRVRS